MPTPGRTEPAADLGYRLAQARTQAATACATSLDAERSQARLLQESRALRQISQETIARSRAARDRAWPRSMVAATYVKDIDASRTFYRLLGLREHSSGKAEASAWAVMAHEGVSVLLASTGPALDIPALPLLFYFFYDDIEAAAGVLEQAGVPVVRTGHPPHALGGEAKVLDPDGNTVLLGQRDRSASGARAEDEGLIRFSILAEAAALVAARGGAPRDCQARGRDGGRCPDQAEVKMADSLGDNAWFCLPHAEEIPVTVPAAFIASHTDRGLAAFLASH